MRDRDQSETTEASAREAFDPGMVAGEGAKAEHDPSAGGGSTSGKRTSAAGDTGASDGRGRGAGRADSERKEGGRLSRIKGETRGLVEDLKEWVDLKIQLIQLDFEDRIRQAANRAALTAVVIVVALLAVLFGLVAAGEALGVWFDSRPLGYLALAGILALLALIIQVLKPRLVEPARTDADADDEPNRLPTASRQAPSLPEPRPDGRTDAAARADAPTRSISSDDR